jgi:hypothetical protein
VVISLVYNSDVDRCAGKLLRDLKAAEASTHYHDTVSHWLGGKFRRCPARVEEWDVAVNALSLAECCSKSLRRFQVIGASLMVQRTLIP